MLQISLQHYKNIQMQTLRIFKGGMEYIPYHILGDYKGAYIIMGTILKLYIFENTL